MFSETIDPASFTAEDTRLKSPDGSDLGPVLGVAGSGTTYTLTLNPIGQDGKYTLQVGPNVADAAGNLMDQNQDGAPGTPADRYAGTFRYQTLTTAGGAISQDAHWSGTVQVTGDLTVAGGVTLTIDPGTVVKLNQAVAITLDGTLDADSKGIRILSGAPRLTRVSVQRARHQAFDVDLAATATLTQLSATQTALNGYLLHGGTLPADRTWDFGGLPVQLYGRAHN